MGDVVNLRRVRKDKRRDGHAARAAANRVAFGRAKEDREADRDAAAKAAARLDGIKRDV